MELGNEPEVPNECSCVALLTCLLNKGQRLLYPSDREIAHRAAPVTWLEARPMTEVRPT